MVESFDTDGVAESKRRYWPLLLLRSSLICGYVDGGQLPVRKDGMACYWTLDPSACSGLTGVAALADKLRI